ncbi:Cytochrome P450 4V2 [Blomia tropicalis]|nr:Cytochrome P450 4V2 [Blomia tropicalis]
MEKFNKLPGLVGSSIYGYLLGDIEVYYRYMWHLKREKAVTQLMGSMFQVESFRKDGVGRFTIGFIRFVALFRAKAVEEVINSMDHIEKANEYKFFKSWLGLGLLTSTGDKWKRHRKLLTPAFHFKILDTFFPVMNENAEIMMERFEKIVDLENSSHRGVDIRSLVADCALDTICETAMGVRVGAQSDDTNIEYVEPLNSVLTQVMHRIMEPLLQLDIVYNITPPGRRNRKNLDKIHSFIRKVIAIRKQEFETTIREKQLDINKIGNEDVGLLIKKRYAFLDSLLITHLQNPNMFTLKDIEDEVNTFMFEGHDTTSVSLIFTLLLVAIDKRVQEKVFDELFGLLGDDPNRQITLEDCRQMKYLEMVIKESLRLYPSVPFIGRKITKEFTANGYSVPAGCTCAIFIYFLHRDPKIFPHPERFIPERFEPDAPIHKMPYAYMPFSAGPRNCIGQKFAMLEMKIMLASIIRRYRMEAITKRDMISIDFSILIKADTPVLIRFDKRSTEE